MKNAREDDPCGATLIAEERLRQILVKVMSERKERCETCRWWESEGALAKSRVGLCRRNPPVALPMLDDDASRQDYEAYPVWPKTCDSEWCGEWKPADA